MKTLKFGHDFASQIMSGQKNSTWRLYDDKDLSVNDTLKLIDKVDPSNPGTWRVIGHGKISQVTEKRLGDITKADMSGHDSFDNREDMLRTYRQYYGERVSYETPVKIIHFDFIPSSTEEPSQAMLLEDAKIYTDGGSRGNPGKSACAYVICKMDENVVEKSGFYLGIATNNQAEYFGIQKALERARDLGIGRVTLFSDSQLVVNQMNGLYKVKNQELAPLHKEVKEIASSFERINFIHVPRELNKIADSEVNRILDEQK